MLYRCLAAALMLTVAAAQADTTLPPVIVKTLAIEPFAESIEALGTLRANEAVTLSATVTETISAVHFEDGQRVKQNQVLVEMTNAEEHALLEEARSARDEAQRQLRRVESLIAAQLSTESALDVRRQAYEAAEARLHATQSRLADRLIVAPFDGIVGLRNISTGTLVRPGDTITTLDDDSVMKLDFSIPAVYLAAVEPGLTVTARSRELGGREFLGKVSSIDSRIDPNTRAITVRARLPNPERTLRPGMLMVVTLNKASQPSLLLPEEALIQEGFTQYVYRLVPDSNPAQVERVEVETGTRRQGEVVITEGLAADDTVVTHGIMRLKDGAEVRIHAEQKSGDSITDMISAGPMPMGESE